MFESVFWCRVYCVVYLVALFIGIKLFIVDYELYELTFLRAVVYLFCIVTLLYKVWVVSK